jgi:hypothetical protein
MQQSFAIEHFAFRPGFREQALAAYNLALDREASDSRLNESFLEQKLVELEAIEVSAPGPYWLTMARLTELTVLCAGMYADSGELQAVGDLLVNPRRILVHVRGKAEPIAKVRHRRLTDQFSHMSSDRYGVIDWLKRETTLEVQKPPLLVELYKTLFDSGFMSVEYMSDLDRRMTQIANTAAFVGTCHFPTDMDFVQYVHASPEAEREFILSNLCGFHRDRFDELGRETIQALYFPHHKSRFLV